jgi:heme/copper-type cytochrome/quinol oxidase subunit 2
MFFNVKVVTQAQFTSWLHTQQAALEAHPGSAPKLPSGVGGSANTSSPNNNQGGDLYGD